MALSQKNKVLVIHRILQIQKMQQNSLLSKPFSEPRSRGPLSSSLEVGRERAWERGCHLASFKRQFDSLLPTSQLCKIAASVI